MFPDFQSAAILASRSLIDHSIEAAPVFPLPILKNTPGVLVASFTEMSYEMGMDRGDLLSMLADEHHDAVTTVFPVNDKLHYLVAYNQQLPFYLLHRALARELGHIVLGHDGSRPEDVRMAEARCFACHLLCPRPLLRAIQDSGIVITSDLIVNLTGCSHYVVSFMRKFPPVHVPAELNRKVKEQFSKYVSDICAVYPVLLGEDAPVPLDLGSYMEGYEE